MASGAMPKPTDKAKAAFTAILPKDGVVATRPMFGNLAAFVNGNMFAGLFGEDLFVRLPDGERAEVKRGGGKDFAPMAGRVMTGYVCVAPGWQTASGGARTWIARSLIFTRQLPPKAAKPAAKPKGRAS
jgi:TfoX/Sxy family transcriptional regulator of competence genes